MRVGRGSVGSTASMLWLAVALAVGHGSSAFAQFYVATEVIYTYPDQGPFRKDEQSLGVGLGVALTPNWNAQVEYDSEKFLTGSSGLFLRKDLLLSGQRAFFADSAAHPFVSFGAGAAHISKGSSYGTVPSISLGAGYTLRLPGVRSWDLQTEVRGRYAYDEHSIAGNQDIVDGQALLRLRYGAPYKPLIATASARNAPGPEAGYSPTPQPIAVSSETGSRSQSVRYAPRDDRDQDGVPNSRDRCPSTIRGVSVDTDGCMVALRQ